MADKLVRIKPSNNRQTHVAKGVTINKTDGWCKVPASIADELAKEKMSELNPDASAFVFDVLDPAQAAVVQEAEAVKADPAGTVESPKEKTVAAPPEPEEPKKRGR